MTESSYKYYSTTTIPKEPLPKSQFVSQHKSYLDKYAEAYVKMLLGWPGGNPYAAVKEYHDIPSLSGPLR